jgi:hypothetical protein
MAENSQAEAAAGTSTNKAQAVRKYLANHPKAKNKQVIDALEQQGISTDPGYASQIRAGAKKKSTKSRTSPKKAPKLKSLTAKYPRHALNKVLRIPRAILDQNAGKECTEKEAAGFVGVGLAGPFRVEVSSAIKYGLIERPSAGHVKITALGKKILRPQTPEDELTGLREAVLKAPEISKVYNHYRGENLPDTKFFDNALVETFGIPQDKLAEFTAIFRETLTDAKLLERHQKKYRVLDISDVNSGEADASERIKVLGRTVKTAAGDTCFVMMPFAAPHGDYYVKIFEPAIQKAGLTPIRADADIFGAGKIMDQIRVGISSAKVLLAELTTKNPNVFYELGLAHALEKPVVLVSSNEADVPFDLQHIRVIYYDVMDPFWGQKLLDKVAENILSAIKNPKEAIFKKALDQAG